MRQSTVALAPPPSEPGRRARKKARTRKDLYDAAMRLFLARGFDAVTIDTICAEADVARATFFLHFPGKDALLLEYGREVTAELAARLARHRGGAAAGLRLALDLLATRAVRHRAVIRLMMREVMARPGALADATAQGRNLGTLLAGVIRAGQEKGELRRGVEPLVAAAAVVSTYFSVVNEWAHDPGAFDLRRVLEQALDVVLNGLSARRRR